MIILSRCADCGHFHSPTRDICPHCLSDNIEQKPVSGRGKLVGTTTLYVSVKPEFEGNLPLYIGLVKLDAGPIVLSYINEDTQSGTVITMQQDNGLFKQDKEVSHDE